MKNQLISLFVLIVLLAGCKPTSNITSNTDTRNDYFSSEMLERYMADYWRTHTRDSIRIKDSVIYHADGSKEVYRSTDKTKTSTTERKVIEKWLIRQSVTIRERQTILKNTEITRTIKKPFNWFQKLFIGTGVIAWILIFIFSIYIIVKSYIKYKSYWKNLLRIK